MSIFRKPFGKTTLLAEDQKPVQPGQPGGLRARRNDSGMGSVQPPDADAEGHLANAGFATQSCTEPNDPEALQALIAAALGDGYAADVERALIDSLLDLAVSVPTSIRCRILLLNALEKEARRRPDIVREYLEKLALLQEQQPLPPGHAADLIAQAWKAIQCSVTAH